MSHTTCLASGHSVEELTALEQRLQGYVDEKFAELQRQIDERFEQLTRKVLDHIVMSTTDATNNRVDTSLSDVNYQQLD